MWVSAARRVSLGISSVLSAVCQERFDSERLEKLQCVFDCKNCHAWFLLQPECERVGYSRVRAQSGAKASSGTGNACVF